MLPTGQAGGDLAGQAEVSGGGQSPSSTPALGGGGKEEEQVELQSAYPLGLRGLKPGLGF